VVVDPVVIPPLNGIYLDPVHLHWKVKVVAACKSGGSALSDWLTAVDQISFLHGDLAKVPAKLTEGRTHDPEQCLLLTKPNLQNNLAQRDVEPSAEDRSGVSKLLIEDVRWVWSNRNVARELAALLKDQQPFNLLVRVSNL
jgi:hypothetical protein